MVPEVKGCSPSMQRMSVDLPAPLGPMTVTISPALTSRLTRSRIVRPPITSVASLALSNAPWAFSMSVALRAGAAFARHFDDRSPRVKILGFRCLAQFREDVGRVELGYRTAGFADEKGRGLALVGVGTGNVGVPAFDLVDKSMGEQEIEPPVDGDRRGPRPMLGHPLDDVIGPHRRMAPRHAGENIAALARQLRAPPRTGPLGPRNQIGGAMGMVVVRLGEGHNVIILHVWTNCQSSFNLLPERRRIP